MKRGPTAGGERGRGPANGVRGWPEVASPLQRRARLARRLARAMVHHKLGGERHFDAHVDSPTGARKRLVLEHFGAAAARALGDGWRLERVTRTPPVIELAGPGGEALGLELTRPGARNRYRDTERFGVGYRYGGADDAILGAVDAVVDALAAAPSPALPEGETVADALWSRAPDELTIHPNSLQCELRPSLACDHACAFCNSVDPRATANMVWKPRAVLEQLDWLEPHHLVGVVISGGEPTLLPDLPAIVGAVADRGYLVELQTNGMALDDPEYARGLRRSGLHGALVSLHTHDPEASDGRITRYEGGWNRTVEGIDNALAAGIRVDISHVIHAANHDHARDFLEMVDRRWGRDVDVRLAFVAPASEDPEEYRRYMPPLRRVAPALRDALAYAERRRLRVDLVGYCGVPPCLIHPYEGFSDVVKPFRAARFVGRDRAWPDACGGCDYRDTCPGLWRGYLEEYGDPGVRPLRRPSRPQAAARWVAQLGDEALRLLSGR